MNPKIWQDPESQEKENKHIIFSDKEFKESSKKTSKKLICIYMITFVIQTTETPVPNYQLN